MLEDLAYIHVSSVVVPCVAYICLATYVSAFKVTIYILGLSLIITPTALAADMSMPAFCFVRACMQYIS